MPDASNTPTPDPKNGPSRAGSPPLPPLVTGRGRRIGEIGLQRLRSSVLLKATAIAAFMGYGGLIFLTIVGRIPFPQAAVVAVMSLASWFFLFWWLPVIESTRIRLGDDTGRSGIGTVLETIAIGCVVLVHVLMAIIVVYVARSPPS